MHKYGWVLIGVLLMVAAGIALAAGLGQPPDDAGEKVADVRKARVLYTADTPATGWQWQAGDWPADRWLRVVDSEASLADLLRARPYLQGRLPGPLDWTQEFLVVAALGVAPSGGYAIRIDKITAAGADVEVRVSGKSPAPSDMVIQIITYPVDAVRLKRAIFLGVGVADTNWRFVDQNGRQVGP